MAEAKAKAKETGVMEHGSSWLPEQPDIDPTELPPVKLDHLYRLTDDTGMLQHASFAVPNFHEGYCIDDNARALMVSVYLEELGHGEAFDLACRYLAFIAYAFNPETGRFRNFMNFQRQWLEENGSEDSHGRTLWALGHLLGRSQALSLQGLAEQLFQQALPAILDTGYARAWAFALLGIHAYLRRFTHAPAIIQIRDELAQRLLRLYQQHRSDDWCWYEDSLTYCNATLAQAMIVCGRSTANSSMTEAGLESLRWLVDAHRDTPEGHFVPVGCNGFYSRGQARARYDQQPVEAKVMVSACFEAYQTTQDRRWYQDARWAFAWFLGRNDLNLPVYDSTTGGCRDGLEVDRINENQGAESTLAFLQALLELRLAVNAA
jgi:hypothetical protein